MTERYPATYLPRKYYLETLDPKWGGSLAFYLERAGTYYHLQDFDAAKVDAKQAMELGNEEAERLYKRLDELKDS